MFPKAALFAIAASAIAAASPTPATVTQCNTGGAQCCNSVQPASSLAAAGPIELLGIVLQDPNVLVGLTCTPITAIGVGQGANCAQQPVCCQNNDFNGLINIGCTPISL